METYLPFGPLLVVTLSLRFKKILIMLHHQVQREGFGLFCSKLSSCKIVCVQIFLPRLLGRGIEEYKCAFQQDKDRGSGPIEAALNE